MDLQAIRERNEKRRALKAAATPRPWKADDCVDDVWIETDFENTGIANLKKDADFEQQKKNAAFIAAARNDDVEDVIDELLAEVEELRARIEGMENTAWEKSE